MRISAVFPLTLLAGCVQTMPALTPGSAATGQWVPFYALDIAAERLDYSYDRASARRSGGHVVARWKVAGTTGTTTLYVIDLACRDGTFTEKGTVMIDAEGRARELPHSELLMDQAIEGGKSSDVFRRLTCR